MMIPWYYRLYLYGIHGFCDEVIFTCLHDSYHIGFDRRLQGYSSISAFFLYGLSSLFLEFIYLTYLKKRFNIFFRCVIYVLWSFSWEFFTGLVLRQLSACPWDYSSSPYNVYGLINLEYTPVWCFCGLIQEVVSDKLLTLKFEENENIIEGKKEK